MLDSFWALDSSSLQGSSPRTFSSPRLIPGFPALAGTCGFPNSTSLPALSALGLGIVNQTVVATTRPAENGTVWRTHGLPSGTIFLQCPPFSKKLLWRTNHQATSPPVRCGSFLRSSLFPEAVRSPSTAERTSALLPLLNADDKILCFVPPAKTRNKPRPNFCQIYLLPLFLSHILGEGALFC